MRAYDIIFKKRNGKELNEEEIKFMVSRYNNGDIADYQMSAFLMSIYFNGMTNDETFFLTNAMIHSGDVLDLSFLKIPTADKHSTGGVGDGTSLIVAPMVASAGVCVPMMSGRALGHTGGTLDKLESIPGFRTDISKKEFLEFLEYAGAALIGQTQEIAPVDKKMYALRDATATVESIPLICSSIMSKKIAEGANTLVLDVKTGNGAFMKKYSDAKELAGKMAEIGKMFNKNVVAMITDMSTPIGDFAGNALEIKQAIEVLKGNIKNDLYELSVDLAAMMIFKAEKAKTIDEAKTIAKKQIDTGKALEKFRQIIKMQGGNPSVIDTPDKILQKSKHSVQIKAQKDGFISQMKTREIGIASMMAGAGREKIEDKIDYSAGIKFYVKTGEKVKKDEVLSEIFYNDSQKIETAANILKDAYVITSEKPEKSNLIKEIIY